MVSFVAGSVLRTKPLVSCIVPTHNRRSLLPRAVVSILSQSFSDIELIIVDDGSTDDTKLYLDKLIVSDHRVRVIRFANASGGGQARNAGIEASRGKYIAFLDDDDQWFQHKLQLQLDCVKSLGARVVGGRFRAVGRTMLAKSVDYQRRLFQIFRDQAKPTVLSANDLLISNCGISPSTLFASRDSLLAVGGFDTSLEANQGRDLFIRLAFAEGEILRLNKVVSIQYQNHAYDRISDRGGGRLDALREVHRRYSDKMDPWVRRFDATRLLVNEAMVEPDRDRRKLLFREALTRIDLSRLVLYLKLYMSYLSSKRI